MFLWICVTGFEDFGHDSVTEAMIFLNLWQYLWQSFDVFALFLSQHKCIYGIYRFFCDRKWLNGWDFCHSVDVLQGFLGVSVTESIHKAGRQPEEDAREVCLFIYTHTARAPRRALRYKGISIDMKVSKFSLHCSCTGIISCVDLFDIL